MTGLKAILKWMGFPGKQVWRNKRTPMEVVPQVYTLTIIGDAFRKEQALEIAKFMNENKE